MADVGIYVKNADIVVRAGANCNATAVTAAETDKYVLDVESYINVACGRNWSDAYGSLNANVKYLLKEAGASFCAMYVVNYSMADIGLAEAQTRLDVLRDKALKAMDILQEKSRQDFMVGA